MTLLPSSSDESETERDGFLSTRREIHATAIGIVAGGVVAAAGEWTFGIAFLAVALGIRASKRTKGLREIRSEPWYAIGGFGAGAAVVSLLLAL